MQLESFNSWVSNLNQEQDNGSTSFHSNIRPRTSTVANHNHVYISKHIKHWLYEIHFEFIRKFLEENVLQ
eukprot:snap_masked-scaffold_15-processed-gene-5.14-mRNA-1 protein AED:1.00 eAED:1.00 QI:0/0/0/0/1/1/2/0/69